MGSALTVIGEPTGILTRQACEIAGLLGHAVDVRSDPTPDAEQVFIALDDFSERARAIASIPREQLVNLVHPTAFVSPEADLGLNVLVGAQSIVAMNATVGDGVTVNALSSIEHDNVIGAHTFLGTGAILCGNVTTGEFVFIGGGATIKPGTTIGARTTIGTGAVLVKDAEPDAVYVGNPAVRR